jgi:hypothetical protein
MTMRDPLRPDGGWRFRRIEKEDDDLEADAPRLSVTAPLWFNLWVRAACNDLRRRQGYVSMTRFIIDAVVEKLERDFKHLDPRRKR